MVDNNNNNKPVVTRGEYDKRDPEFRFRPLLLQLFKNRNVRFKFGLKINQNRYKTSIFLLPAAT